MKSSWDPYTKEVSTWMFYAFLIIGGILIYLPFIISRGIYRKWKVKGCLIAILIYFGVNALLLFAAFLGAMHYGYITRDDLAAALRNDYEYFERKDIAAVAQEKNITFEEAEVAIEKEKIAKIEAEKLENILVGAWWSIIGDDFVIYTEDGEFLNIKDNEISIYRFEVINNEEVVIFDNNNKKVEGLPTPTPSNGWFDRGVVLSVDNAAVKGEWKEGPNAGRVVFDGIDTVIQSEREELLYNIEGETLFLKDEEGEIVKESLIFLVESEKGERFLFMRYVSASPSWGGELRLFKYKWVE